MFEAEMNVLWDSLIKVLELALCKEQLLQH